MYVKYLIIPSIEKMLNKYYILSTSSLLLKLRISKKFLSEKTIYIKKYFCLQAT